MILSFFIICNKIIIIIFNHYRGNKNIYFFFFFSKGDVAIHNEISVFVYRYDLKQSQIARMACNISFLFYLFIFNNSF
jgi:hypothetical protein